MKKMLRLAAALAVLAAMTSFIACSNDDDSGNNGSTSQSGNSGETGGSSSGSTETIDLSGKYYELYFGKNLQSCIYFETASTGTIWVVNDDRTGSTKKTFTYVTKSREDFFKAIDITWEGASEATEALFSSPDSYEYLQVKVAWADDSEPWDYFAVSEKPTIPGESDSGSSSGSTSGSETKTLVLDVSYDLTANLPSEITNSDQIVSDSWTAPAATPETNDITWSWLTTETRKVKSNSGLQVSNGTSPEALLTLTAESNFTVTITYKFAGTYAADKVRCIIVGDKSDFMTADTNKDNTYTLTSEAAKSVVVAANGMKITKIETKAAN